MDGLAQLADSFPHSKTLCAWKHISSRSNKLNDLHQLRRAVPQILNRNALLGHHPKLRLRPSRLARYSALSASSITLSSESIPVSSCIHGNGAQPIEHVLCTCTPFPTSNGRSRTASSTRVHSSPAFSRSVVRQTNRNSSPPQRTRSSERRIT